MAEKSFGVKEINLIGASGTPTIESPNNLNLNAVNVAISTNASIGGNLTVSGNVGIAGTLTYEDVTNIDSVGVVTARAGLKVTGGTSFFAGAIAAAGAITGTASTATTVTVTNETSDTETFPTFTPSATGNQNFKTNTSLKFNTSTGQLNATKFVGDGSGLTGIAVTEAPVTDYTITANGSSAYRFHGGGVDETADDPDLYLIRGQKYRFNNTTGSSHPFAIREASGGSAYSNGVTGSQNGIQFFTVPYDAPASLFYQCTVHSGMVGNIYIRGAAGQNTNVGITTFTGMAFFRNDLTVSSSGLAVNIFESTDNHSRLRIKSGSSSLSQLEFADQDDADAGEIRYDHGNDRMTFHVGNNDEKLRITSGGKVNIGGDYSQTTRQLGVVSSVEQVASFEYNGADADGSEVRFYHNSSSPADDDTLAFLQFSGKNSADEVTLYSGITAESSDVTNGTEDGNIIFSTRSNGSFGERVRIHSNGCVTKPTNAMFKAVRTSNQSVSSNGWHVIQYNSDTATGCFDIGSNFDTSNHRFTAPVAGYYHFGLNQRIDGGNGDYFRVAFTVDGATPTGQYPYGHAIYRDSDGFSYYTFSITSLIYLTAGQYVRAEAYSSSDTSWTLQDESQFYGYLVG